MKRREIRRLQRERADGSITTSIRTALARGEEGKEINLVGL